MANTDDIDDLKNKRVRTCGELLQNHLKIIVSELFEAIKNRLEIFEKKKNTNIGDFKINKVLKQRTITKEIKNFFTSNPLSQLMDEINPLSEITHKRKVCAFGIGAVDKNRSNLNVREIHPSHFGRVCPIETAEGKNTGLILSLARNITLDRYGMIESPFYLWYSTKN